MENIYRKKDRKKERKKKKEKVINFWKEQL